VAGVFVILGSVLSGAGTTRTLTQLGAVNAMAGSFTVALAVGVAVAWMTHLKLPVSTSQAIVGGIIGWNLFTGSPTDSDAIMKILGTWVTSPILAAVFAFVLFKLMERLLKEARIHLLEIDAYTRAGLLIVGALASYALGANNIANVMGLFVAAAPFNDIALGQVLTFTGTQQLFLIGGIAIAVGIFTYGQKVMVTVGGDLYRITPLSGLVVVLAQSIVLFLFSSVALESFLRELHLPTFPLVPLSSTQAVIGGVVGVGLAKRGRGINVRVLGKIAAGWVIAPVAAFVMTYVLLFFVQNVFEQRVIADSKYHLSAAVLEAAGAEGVAVEPVKQLTGRNFSSAIQLRADLEALGRYTRADINVFLRLAKIDSLIVDSAKVTMVLEGASVPQSHMFALKKLDGRVFLHRCDLERALGSAVVRSDSLERRVLDVLTPLQRDALVDAFRVRPLLPVK
jgi:PiT family inorganic phosphate transporter